MFLEGLETSEVRVDKIDEIIEASEKVSEPALKEDS